MNSPLDAMYQQIILDHSKQRQGSGLRPAPDGATAGQSHQLNPVCGDEITLRLALADGAIGDVSWEGNGCAISMASASVLATLVRERIDDGVAPSVASFISTVDAFREMMRSRGTIDPDEDLLGDAAAFAGVARYPARVKCAMLAWVAFEEALVDARP